MAPLPHGDMNATLGAYLDELDRWSTRLNLTSIPREQMWERNVVEVQELLRVAAPPPRSRVVDIGSGGGVPGIVIAVLRPDLSVTLLDSDRRKSAFLNHVAGLLGLSGVIVATLRAEDAGRRNGMRESFDLATSRATAPPPVLCEIGLPLVRVGGILCALVASALTACQTCAAAAAACGGGAPEAPANGVLRVGKVARTPDAYPRRAGTPARHPIS
ncbi:MAG TPA: 16S rRNA (guanine(527)-N(7))-methyltransferase RsmG [Candidatus Saccharimonadales bacterium]|nr:16S rRNA (guanine(527)-N(7))-methyltransferase RsmG [Candidatus Saccharimonadales bacterium]